MPVVLSYAASQPFLNLHLFGDYLVVVVPPICLLAGLGLAVLPWRRVPYALALGLLLLAVPAVPLYYANAHRQDYRTVAHWLGQRYKVGDGLVCTEDGSALAMDYYLRAYAGPAHFPGDPHPQCTFAWRQQHARPVTAQTLTAYGAEHARIFYISAIVSGDSAEVKMHARMTRQWLDTHYHFISQVVAPAYYGPVVGRLYATESMPPNR